MSTKDKPPVSIRIRLKYPDIDTFIEKYATNISRGGMFIQSRVPQPVGTALRFEVLLQDDTPLLRGEGTVIWIKEYDAAHPTRVHGMGVRFVELDDPSRAMIELVLSEKNEPRGRSQTQEVRALVGAAAPADQEEPLVDETEDDEGTMVQEFGSLEPTPPDPSPEAAAPEVAPAESRFEGAAADPTPETAPESIVESALADPSLDASSSRLTPAIAPAPTDPAPTIQHFAAPIAPFAEAAPPLVPSRTGEELARLASALEAGGDGVSVALEMAEQVLSEICSAAGLDEERIAAVAMAALGLLAGVEGTSDELELLLASATRPAASLAPPSVLVAPAVVPAPTPGPAPEDERDFDPSLLQAAARTARAAKQERSNGSFDLSDGRGVTGEFALGAKPAPELQPTPPPAAPAPPPAAPAADPGWRKLQTVTELLDHGSSQVLQDMAARAGRHDLEEPALARGEPSFVEADDEVEQATALGTDEPAPEQASEPAPEHASEPDEPAPEHASEPDEPAPESASDPFEPAPESASEAFESGAIEPALEPEESATEPFLEPEAIDELSREIWKEVVDEAAEELDRLELPGDEPIAAGASRSLDDEGGPTMLHEGFFGGDRGEGPADLDLLASPGASSEIAGDDLYEDDDLGGSSESTQVTAMPVFADRAPRARFVEAALEPDAFQPEREPDAFEAGGEPDGFEPDLDPDTLEPALEAESPSEIEDALPPDPDLSSEVFETLAGLRDTLRERPEGEPAATEPRPPASDDLDGIPSLEALADSQPAPPPSSEPTPDQLEVLATDPDAPDPKPSIKPRRSGIFRRIFGKKE